MVNGGNGNVEGVGLGFLRQGAPFHQGFCQVSALRRNVQFGNAPETIQTLSRNLDISAPGLGND